ncbi:hypothetical protein N0Y54_29150 [Nostoc punctiforme UO1]|uniref:hypothetical protein n=1 Tax=Nostoc punctiforme TaxID=272131 RepID=UPI003098DBAF
MPAQRCAIRQKSPTFSRQHTVISAQEKLLFFHPKVNQLLSRSEESLGIDARTQVQVVGLPAQIACSRDSARDLRISAFD